MRTVFRAGRAIVDGAERPAAVVVDGGRITAVLPLHTPVDAAREVVLAEDEVLLPGLVDTHVHINEPGRTEWEGFASATRAAAAGGVTTLVDMPLNSLPPTVDVAALERKRRAADGQCAVDVGFWGGAVPGNAGGLRALHDAGVFGVKCFLLPSGVDEFPPLAGADLAGALREVAAFDGLLIAHAEDAGVIAAAPAPEGRSYAAFLRSRPGAAEDTAVAGLVALARETGARVHVVHLSSAGALPTLAAARADGVAVTVETCPHYLALTAEEVPDGDTRFKCCPPVREAGNRDALWQGLVDGTIDMVVSDHSPGPAERTEPGTGDFGRAWGGIASLQLGLPIVWTEARRRGHGLATVVGWMAQRPAELVGLTGKGRIAPGCAADLTVFAPEQRFVVGRLQHRNPVTPYAGRELHGVVRRSWLRGEPVDGDRPRGRLLARGAG